MKLKDEMERVVQEETAITYGRLMRSRLGLRFANPQDETTLFSPLLEMMEAQRLDFHGTFRTLCFFRPRVLRAGEEAACDAFVRRLVELSEPGEGAREWERKRGEWRRWLEVYAARIMCKEERALWVGIGEMDEEREQAMRGVNPRFVLRQWVLEEVIKRVEEDVERGRRILGKVMLVRLRVSLYTVCLWWIDGDESV